MAKLTEDEIRGVYEELGQMQVALDAGLNRGIQYFRERLAVCRVMQDRVGELRLKATLALTDAMHDELVQKLQYRLTPTDVVQTRIDEAKGRKDDHKLLLDMVKAHAALLSRTGTDIRALAEMTKEQIKLGEIDPKDAPGAVQPVSDQELAASVPAPASTLGPPADIIDGIQDAPAPAQGGEPAVDFEDLFGALNGKPGSRLN